MSVVAEQYYQIIWGNWGTDGLNYGSVSGINVIQQRDKYFPVYSKGAYCRIVFGQAIGNTLTLHMNAQRYSEGMPVIVYQLTA